MANNSDWWTAPTESENGNLIMVTGRRDIENFKNKQMYDIIIAQEGVYESDYRTRKNKYRKYDI